VVSQSPSPAGRCPAGSATLPPKALEFPGSGQCYRKTGKPLTITSAAVTYVRQPATNQQPASYGLLIKLPATGRAALLAITTKAYHARESLAIIVAGKTWGVPLVEAPFTGGQFEIPAQTANQALQLQRTLVPSD
jgi:preprotein translocase subunit SecD